jgi:hypothetical protein
MFFLKSTEPGNRSLKARLAHNINIFFHGLGLIILLSGCLPVNTPTPEPSPDAHATETASQQTTGLPSEVPPASETPSAPNSIPTTLPSDTPTIPLPTPTPLVDIPEPKMGVETHSMQTSVLAAFQTADLEWTRRNSLLWSVVEPVEGERNWGDVASLENDLSNSSKQGINTILIIHSTPLWAQQVYGHPCGSIKEEKLEAFAAFMKDLVTRYSVPPFNVKYWEIGNEPDIDPSLVSSSSLYGCWGDQNDPYYGGGFYGKMLKAVYPAIKAADPDAKVLNGGLLLDCDPTHPPAGKDCKPSLFFKGILESGAADYFDIVSFHGYSYYPNTWENIENTVSWVERGGSVMGKVSYLREVMEEYNVEKPIFITEGSLLCPEGNKKNCNPPSDEFYQVQANYAVRFYVRNWAAGIAGTIWYDFEGPGWRYAGMLDRYQNPKLDYKALKFLLAELQGASYHREVPGYQNVQVYEFSLPEKRVWVLWPTGDDPQEISTPGDSLQVLDIYGNALSSLGSTLQITSPIYIELKP